MIGFRIAALSLLSFFAAWPARADKEINCVIVMQYTPDLEGSEDQAKNEDLLKSADVVAAKLGDAVIEKVTSDRKLQKALDAFTSGKRCCKTITILSHGLGDGALLMPYDLPKSGTGAPIESGKENRLGGSVGKTAWGKEQLDAFTKSIKKASCTKQPSVTLDGCWTAAEGGIAEQLSERGVATSGFTGSCDFGYSEDEKTHKKEYHGPEPKKDTDSEEKSFKAK